MTLLGLYEADARSDAGGLPSSWFVLWFALAAIAYLAALVSAGRRSTRLLGQGTLLGLTTLLLAGMAVVLLQGVFTST